MSLRTPVWLLVQMAGCNGTCREGFKVAETFELAGRMANHSFIKRRRDSTTRRCDPTLKACVTVRPQTRDTAAGRWATRRSHPWAAQVGGDLIANSRQGASHGLLRDGLIKALSYLRHANSRRHLLRHLLVGLNMYMRHAGVPRYDAYGKCCGDHLWLEMWLNITSCRRFCRHANQNKVRNVYTGGRQRGVYQHVFGGFVTLESSSFQATCRKPVDRAEIIPLPTSSRGGSQNPARLTMAHPVKPSAVMARLLAALNT